MINATTGLTLGTFFAATMLTAGCHLVVADSTESGGLPADFAPDGLRVGLFAEPAGVRIHHARPTFSWRVPLTKQGDVQAAYQLQVASNAAGLVADAADVWDSGTIQGADSTAVRYGGPALLGGAALAWRVRTWNVDGAASGWSAPQAFRMADTLLQEEAGRGRIDPRLPVDFTLAGLPAYRDAGPAGEGAADGGRRRFGGLRFARLRHAGV